ncbi:histidine phosphatase family protein [Microaceticoccus formicicus]|uniref:histidine phosphatase family protein n=1 Tax=Microaceticoccus formicicus TaxID=3118105 RepID=UPI003CD029E6|nr:histidine phosphatase family protein [Peptoniphilaceae bacterium AMB_02]
MDIILIRHGETEDNIKSIFSNDTTKLTELGKKQMLNTAKILKKYSFTKVIISEYFRTKQSLEYLGITGIEHSIDKRVNEFNFGVLKGASIDGAQEKYRDVFTDWYNDPYNFVLPNGESQKQLLERVSVLYKELINNNESVLIITHDGVIRAFICALFETKDVYFKLKSDNGSISIIRHENGYSRLYKYNET